MATNRTPFDQLVDEFSPEVREAFLASYDRIKAQVTPSMLKRIVEELKKGNVEAAIDLLGIDRAAFGGLDMAISDTFNRGGMVMASEIALRDLSGSKVSVSFGVRNLVAEAILRDFSATMVTRETEQVKDLLRVGLSEGLARGNNPTRTALDMVGRVNRVTGKRDGGYLGLSGPQERTQANARSALASGDVEGMRSYLQLKQRDKRFDAMVLRAIKSGKGLNLDDAAKVVGRLNDRQLKFRADKVALHETFAALSLAKSEGMRQAIESGKVDVRFVLKKWKHSGNDHARLDHRRLHNTEVGFNDSFIMGDGTMMAFPHSPNAPPRHTIGCGCTYEIRVDYIGQMVERQRMAS